MNNFGRQTKAFHFLEVRMKVATGASEAYKTVQHMDFTVYDLWDLKVNQCFV
jgi:hypothetical protein